jgi:hypothetical protein
METLKNFLALVTSVKLCISFYKYLTKKFPQFFTKQTMSKLYYSKGFLKFTAILFVFFAVVLLFQNVLIYTFIFLRSNLSIEGFVTGFLVFCLLTIYPILFLHKQYIDHKREMLFKDDICLN